MPSLGSAEARGEAFGDVWACATNASLPSRSAGLGYAGRSTTGRHFRTMRCCMTPTRRSIRPIFPAASACSVLCQAGQPDARTRRRLRAPGWRRRHCTKIEINRQYQEESTILSVIGRGDDDAPNRLLLRGRRGFGSDRRLRRRRRGRWERAHEPAAQPQPKPAAPAARAHCSADRRLWLERCACCDRRKSGCPRRSRRPSEFILCCRELRY